MGIELRTSTSHAFTLTTKPHWRPHFVTQQSSINTQLLSEMMSVVVFINFNPLLVEFCVCKAILTLLIIHKYVWSYIINSVCCSYNVIEHRWVILMKVWADNRIARSTHTQTLYAGNWKWKPSVNYKDLSLSLSLSLLHCIQVHLKTTGWLSYLARSTLHVELVATSKQAVTYDS